jgi:FkbM family methyltransferase
MLRRALRRILTTPFANKQKALIFRRRARLAGLSLRVNSLYFELERDNKILRLGATHAVYLPDMISNFDHYVDSVIPVQEVKHVTNLSGLRYHRLVGFADVSFLFPSLTEPYATTKEYLDFADLRPGQTVLDIGAYAGVTSIIFAKLVGPTGHVYAFEADGANYECARINVEMAEKALGIRNITLFHKAIWSHNRGLRFSSEGAMGSSAVEFTGGGRGKEVRVSSTTIEEFLSEAAIEHVDFIKMDIEGAETEVLRHSAGFLLNTKTKMIIEPHKIKGKMNTGACQRLLEAAGFSVRLRDQVGASVPLIEAV